MTTQRIWFGQLQIRHLSLRKHACSNTLKISPPKNENFVIKNSDIFPISAQNIDCRYSLEPPRRGSSNEYPQSMFLNRNKKNNVYPCKPQFYYIKMSLRGSKLYRYVFVMLTKILTLFFFLHKRYSLGALQQGASNGYPRHILSWRNKKTLWIILLYEAWYGTKMKKSFFRIPQLPESMFCACREEGNVLLFRNRILCGILQ